jgi:hypothetical protein
VTVAVSRVAHGAPMPAASGLHTLSAALDREWRMLTGDAGAVARARSWAVVSPVHRLDDVLVACGYAAGPTGEDENAALVELVTLARHDELAGRVVVQRILPGLMGIARRRRVFERDAFDELVGAAWLTIRHARPGGKEHLAGHLVRDAAYRAFTAPGRRLSSTEIAVDPRTLDEEPFVERVAACEELAMLLADARASGVPSADLDLIRDLAVVGSPGRVAALRNVTPRTVRNHRDRATAHLRHVAAA